MRLDEQSAAKWASGLAFSLTILAACLTYFVWYEANDRSEVTPYLIAWTIASAVAGTALFATTRGPGRGGAVGVVVAATTLPVAAALAIGSASATVANDLLVIGAGASLMMAGAVIAHLGEPHARRLWDRVRRHSMVPSRRTPGSAS